MGKVCCTGRSSELRGVGAAPGALGGGCWMPFRSSSRIAWLKRSPFLGGISCGTACPPHGSVPVIDRESREAESSDVVSELDDSEEFDGALCSARCRGTPSLAPNGRPRPCLACVCEECSSTVHAFLVKSRRVRRLQMSRTVRSLTRYRTASCLDVSGLL